LTTKFSDDSAGASYTFGVSCVL